MARFGDFTLLDDLGSSAVADRHKATHATLGGPFFLKIYRRLPTWQHAELARRGDALIGVSHPNLAAHMGHGVVDGIPFVVSPWLDGLDLAELASSLKDRRVNLTLDQCLLILADLTIAITALHRITPDARLAHGDVSIGHVRVGPDGAIRLTGLVTPRGLEPGKVPDPRFDLAGTGALLYDLVPLLRGGAARPPLPTLLDRVIRRALAIGPLSEHLTPPQFTERLAEVFAALKLSPDRAGFVDVVQRTLRALEKKAAEARPKLASDGMPELIPVTKPGPILEPLPPRHAPVTPAMAPIPAPAMPPMAPIPAVPVTTPPLPAVPVPTSTAPRSPFSAPAPSPFGAPPASPFSTSTPTAPPFSTSTPTAPPFSTSTPTAPPFSTSTPPTPSFGAPTPSFGAPPAPPFGAPPAPPFGAPPAPPFGAPPAPPFGAPPASPFSASPAPSPFGAPASPPRPPVVPQPSAPTPAPWMRGPSAAPEFLTGSAAHRAEPAPTPVVAPPVVAPPVVAPPVVAPIAPPVVAPVAPPVVAPVAPPVVAPPVVAPPVVAPPVVAPAPPAAPPLRPATQPQFVVPSLASVTPATPPPPTSTPAVTAPRTPPQPFSMPVSPPGAALVGDTTLASITAPSTPPTESELSLADALDVMTAPMELPGAHSLTGPAIIPTTTPPPPVATMPTTASASPASAAAPRPATMPMMPVVPMVPPPGGPKKAPLLADADDSTMEAIPAFAQPAPPSSGSNPALTERTDPDATRPLRIEAQKALPAVKALLSAGVVSVEQVEQAASEQAARGGRTIEILVAHGWCSDDDVADCLARSAARRRLVDAALVVKDRALLKRLPQTYALARRLLPLALDGGTLVLAVADPFDTRVIDEVRELVHALDVDVGVAGRGALTQATMKAFADLHGAQVAGNGPRVLLCTADDGKAQQFGARLVQEGMQVEHVVDGVTARSIIQTRPPDAVIAAHDLPGVDGQGLLLAARHGEKTVELPVFILGPRADDDLMARVLDLGADDYFGEPVRPDVMVAKLRRAVGKAAARPSTPPAPAPAPPPVSAPPPLPKRVPPPTAAPLPTEGFAFDDLPDLPPEFDAGPAAADVPAMPTGVMGTLRQMSLPEIVQSLEMGRKTASVDIVPQDGEKGAIAFETGAIKFAECGALVGDQAFFALMRHKEGFFRIHYGDAPKSINIDAPTTFLLLEAMRLMDEEGA
jgi:CheY-like chemotaxis protein